MYTIAGVGMTTVYVGTWRRGAYSFPTRFGRGNSFLYPMWKSNIGASSLSAHRLPRQPAPFLVPPPSSVWLERRKDSVQERVSLADEKAGPPHTRYSGSRSIMTSGTRLSVPTRSPTSTMTLLTNGFVASATTSRTTRIPKTQRPTM